MLTPVKSKNRVIESYKKENGVAFFFSEFGTTRIGFYEGDCVRVSFTEGKEFKEGQGEYLKMSAPEAFEVKEEKTFYRLTGKTLEVFADKKTGAIS